MYNISNVEFVIIIFITSVFYPLPISLLLSFSYPIPTCLTILEIDV